MNTDEIYGNNKNISYIRWKELIHSINKFTTIGLNRESLYDIYYDSLSVLSKFPKFDKSAFFILNNSFSFELTITNPNNYLNEFNEIFDYLVETGDIGHALDTSKSININLEEKDEIQKNIFIVPLRTSKLIVGIILIIHNNRLGELDQLFYQFVGLFANLIGTTIENFHFKNELEISKSSLEQKIAMRTLDLAQSRREIKAIFDSVLAGIIVFDLSINKIVRVNPMACKIIGDSESNIVGKNIFDYLDYFNYSNLNDFPKNENYFESFLITKDKTNKQILRNITRIPLNNRVLINESFVDISKIKEAEYTLNEANQILEQKVIERTEDLQIIVEQLKEEIKVRVAAEAKIRKMYEEQKELNDLKTRFVSMISHEFRTPLTLIKSSAQMVTKFKDVLTINEKINYLDRISHSVDSLTDMIENVIFIGKNESNKYNVNNEYFDFKIFIDGIINFFQLNSIENIEFELNISNLSEQIYTDKRLLRIILNNLISNAIKYSKNNPKICIEAKIEADNLIISVTDFGIGIPPNELDRIFDLFYRAKNVNTIKGTGLGLIVVSESLQKLEGRIEYKSIINEGSVFSIFIPLKNENIY